MPPDSDTLKARFAPGLLVVAVALPPLVVIGNPAVALLAGAVVSMITNRTLVADASRFSKLCLQTAIVLLGFRLNVQTVWSLSADYAVLTTGYVVCTAALGLLLGVLLRVDKVPAQLISAGTAICGGTTIASLSPLLGARSHETAVTLGLVFMLNAVALFSFPAIGHWLGLSQLEFGLWSALSIHDTSSVVATAAIYGDTAQDVATTIKLGRTLWLIPAVFIAGLIGPGGNAKLRVPGFILLFLLAASLTSFTTLPAQLIDGASAISKALLVAALFLVGTEITRATLRKIHGRVVWQAIILWLAVAPLSLLAVRFYAG